VLGCQAAEGPAGLFVTSGGTLQRLDEKATLVPVAGLPSNVRQVAAAGGTIVVVTADEQYLVASSAAPAPRRATRRPADDRDRRLAGRPIAGHRLGR
jgi:hypothetical protein